MTEFKHGKYIFTKVKETLADAPAAPWGGHLDPEIAKRVMYFDSDVFPGAFFVECAWFWPTDKEDKGSPEAHTHDYDEVLAFFGSNPDDTEDLGGEIEIWIDNEKNMMNKSFLAFIPAGIKHSPLWVRNVKRPIFHFAVGTGKHYF